MTPSLLKLVFALLAIASLPVNQACAVAPLPAVRGIIWQLHEEAPDARGRWDRLGARELLLQWTVVDGVAYVPGTPFRTSARMPDWARIRREPWARTFIVGLSGRADEEETRASIPAMATESLRISRMSFPFQVSGWYFPAELDPTWTEAPRLIPPALERLPRPLWISAYDRSNMGADEFAQWLDSFVPKDVGVLFQDGVGVWARTPAVAREYADALRRTLGRDRVRIIAEAFREQEDGSFRRAEASELRPQLQAYRGYQLYLFDGPHYVPDAVIGELLRR